MHVIVVTFDNTDPAVYGPYDSEDEAHRGMPSVERELRRKGVSEHHIEQMLVRPLRGAAI